MKRVKVVPLLVPPDNYTYLLVCEKRALAIDVTNAQALLSLIENQGVTLDYILSTHHHSDHTLGNVEVKKATGCKILGLDERIPGISKVLSDGEVVQFCSEEIRTLHVPGHTKHQAAFYLPSQGQLFTGDTLFGAGCGRLFECGPEKMYSSLLMLSKLPEETSVYFGHEYTKENLDFASAIEPQNPDIVKRLLVENDRLSANKYTTPSTIALEKSTNPFLRCNEQSVRRELDMVGRSPVAVFTELRKRKDKW
ncbi:hydroxyacylglutathione hydrolase [Chitinispirillales bacterium ANBcel5]|uniref:hydroxyacylglutathione hydrolase n=1 Tax=Cellulosispirillum alkaliphilum TaxID=3039283 RepID=UPI002A57BF32|nr:hydroxyacylglutathione hydrolase [Chitinispirillales bacterium ANBcel5]